ncbi:MAG: PorP/SprF family type IX secretion system membrane protein [Bacteroidota bacterium]
MHRIWIIILLLYTGFALNAQDIHFSQYNSSPLNLNPALSGKFEGDHRFIANQRNQWSSITVPYRTYAFSYDTKVHKIPEWKSVIGVGMQINSDRAGDGDFGTTQIKLSPAIHKDIKGDSTLIASFGFNVNFNQHSINFDAFYFGNQFDGNRFDATLPHNEIFAEDNLNYIDFALGAAVFFSYKDIPFNVSIAWNHLNKPEQSFFSEYGVSLSRKFNVSADSYLSINEDIDLFPGIVWYRQGKFNELNIGGILRKAIDDYKFRNIYFGGWMRARDAGILMLGIDYQNFNVGISYDINFSKLRAASNGRGGMELSLIYIFSNPRPYDVPYHRQCPVFM